MGLELRQQLKLSQQLVMTPQLQQAIKLLQLSRLELLDTVQQELLENPMLEEQVEETSVEGQGKEEQDRLGDEIKEIGLQEGDITRSAEWEDYLGVFSSAARQGKESEVPEEMMPVEARYAAKPSLEGHLLWQLRLSDFTQTEQRIGDVIIGNLDSYGYLQSTFQDIAEFSQTTEDEVERVHSRVKLFDPVGVASRSVEECLLVQLEVLGEDDPILFTLVREHLQDLEKRRFKPLASKFKISLEQIKDYLDVIQSLDPMPGNSFGDAETNYVSPDAYIYKYDEDFVIVLNDDGLPKLQLSPFYMEELNDKGDENRDYLQDKMRSAMWLMKSLYQRQRTLYKVLESLIRFQREFFESGVSHLKPLILKEVAEDISMHESTVSRITTNKYVSTPFGVFELKFFFNSGLGVDGGGQVGSESVKAAIKKMVAEENPKKPLSDEKIAARLKEELQVNIARRTVAKYRVALNIPSSSKRKEII